MKESNDEVRVALALVHRKKTKNQGRLSRQVEDDKEIKYKNDARVRTHVHYVCARVRTYALRVLHNTY